MGSGTSRGWERPSCSEADEDWELACWCFGGGGECCSSEGGFIRAAKVAIYLGLGIYLRLGIIYEVDHFGNFADTRIPFIVTMYHMCSLHLIISMVLILQLFSVTQYCSSSKDPRPHENIGRRCVS